MNKDIFSLKNTISLVTGATGYLGKAMCFALAEKGSKVYVNGRNQEKILSLVQELRNFGFEAEIAVFDIQNETEIENFFKEFKESKLNILVNNAYSGKSGSIETATSSDFMNSYEVSVVAAFLMAKNSLKLFNSTPENETKSIINISTMYGMVSPDLSIYADKKSCNPPFYGAAKAGLIQFTKYAATEFSSLGIRVNSICPGPFPGDEALKNEVLMKKIKDKTLLGRLGTPEEIKGAVLFLASSASSFVTGSNIVVDGGWTVR
jgi:NAD(P)-dependent dehydrogenase (short-subunit alcohol dehydrogenase family)